MAQQDDGVTGQAGRLRAAARRRMGRATAMAGRRHSRAMASQDKAERRRTRRTQNKDVVARATQSDAGQPHDNGS